MPDVSGWDRPRHRLVPVLQVATDESPVGTFGFVCDLSTRSVESVAYRPTGRSILGLDLFCGMPGAGRLRGNIRPTDRKYVGFPSLCDRNPRTRSGCIQLTGCTATASMIIAGGNPGQVPPFFLPASQCSLLD